MIKPYTVSYAQNREDIILSGFFGAEEKGFYVDIGAYDPEYDSVTKLFYLRGWTGINVEPQPDRFEYFVKKRQKDVNVNVGISDKPDVLRLRSYDNQGLSTFSPEMKSEYEKEKVNDQTAHYTDLDVKVVTLKQLFVENNVKKIQFLKVDVEGLEYEVLDGNDWVKYRPEVICIEANHVKRDWRKLLKNNNYSLTFYDGLNEYYTDNATKRAQQFDYVQTIIFQEPIVNFKMLEDLKDYDKLVQWLESTNKKLRAELEDTQLHAHNLQTTLDEVLPLRKHLKRTLRYHLGRVDRKVARSLARSNNFKPVPVNAEADSQQDALKLAQISDNSNFTAFNRAPRQHPLMPVYRASRKAGVKTVSKLRTVSRKHKS